MAKKDKTENAFTYLKSLVDAYEHNPDVLKRAIITNRDLVPEPIPGQPRGVTKRPLGWPLFGHPIFYTVKVKKNVDVCWHQHDEDIFRYIAEGSLEVKIGGDRKTYKFHPGDWFVIRACTEYCIKAGGNGYRALSGYQKPCAPA